MHDNQIQDRPTPRRRHRLAVGVAALLTVGGMALAGPTVGARAGDPPGANGTVKIDAEEFDTHPDNQPHVGCRFQVDFYGFDEGDFNATVTFTAHPPTGRSVLLEDSVPVGEDAAGGGTDLDAEREYDLADALAGFTPHPKQGYHERPGGTTNSSRGPQGSSVAVPSAR